MALVCGTFCHRVGAVHVTEAGGDSRPGFIAAILLVPSFRLSAGRIVNALSTTGQFAPLLLKLSGKFGVLPGTVQHVREMVERNNTERRNAVENLDRNLRGPCTDVEAASELKRKIRKQPKQVIDKRVVYRIEMLFCRR